MPMCDCDEVSKIINNHSIMISKMKTKVGIFRQFLTAFCLFCINLVAMANETLIDWEQYGSGASFPYDVEVYSGNNGSLVYTIKTDKGLAWVAYVTNQGLVSSEAGDNLPSIAGFQDCNVKLANDIDLSSSTIYSPIGTIENPFLGFFDGNYHVVKGLNVSDVESAGLFGYVGKYSKLVYIGNLGVEAVTVSGTKYAGAIAGWLYGQMRECWSSGSVTATPSESNGAAGGLVGCAGIPNEGPSYIGYCYSTANVSCDAAAGGIVGKITDSSINRSYSTGTISGNTKGSICGTISERIDIRYCLALNAGNANESIGLYGTTDSSNVYLDHIYWSANLQINLNNNVSNNGECKYDNITNFVDDYNNPFTFDGTYLPKLTGFEDNQPTLVAYEYVGGGEIIKDNANCTVEFVDKTVSSAVYGETVKFTVAPVSEWYKIKDVKVNIDNNGSLGDQVSVTPSDGSYSFTMPLGAVKITVTTEAIDTWEEYAVGAVKDTDYTISGTTYTINTVRGLAWVANVTNNGLTSSSDNDYPDNAGFEGHTVTLGDNISLAQPEGSPEGWASWTPIGTSDYPFLGTFDGNYHVVTGLTVTRYQSAGLFGYVGSIYNEPKIAGTICNLGVDGANVDGIMYAGALVGKLYGTMEKCWSSGSVKVASPTEIPYGNVAAASVSDNPDYSDTSNEEFGGGLVGEATDGSTISNCYSTAEVSALCTGGIVGVLHGTLEYCYATGKVTSSSETNSGPAGGICGAVRDSSNIINCFAMNAGGITGSTDKIGRIWGEGNITGSTNYASTKISGTWTTNATGKDGEGVKYSGYISYVKNNWSQDVWTISNKNLPQLNGMSGQPTLSRDTYMEVDVDYITITPPSCGRIEVYQDGVKLEPDGENKIEVANGSIVTIKAIADEGYGCSWLKIDGVERQGDTVENYVVRNDITISASFYYIIPSVFMYEEVCYEKRWDANYWEEVQVSPIKMHYYDKNYIGDLNLPEKVIYSNDYGKAEFRLTAIADSAFEGSGTLKSVAIPSTINRIGSYAFKDCTGMEKLVVKSPSSVTRSATEPAVPTVGEHAFDDICETAVLYVPEGWKEAFKDAPEWNKLINVKEQQQDGTVLAELTITASSGGTLSVGSITSQNNDTKTLKVAEGTDVIVDVATAEGYKLESLTCDGNDVIGQLVDSKLTISGISGENSIVAVFGIDTSIGGTDASAQRVSIKDGKIVVEGVAAGEVIFIYIASGHLLHRKVANGEPIEIPMTAGQVYIVKIGKQSIKLM